MAQDATAADARAALDKLKALRTAPAAQLDGAVRGIMQGTAPDLEALDGAVARLAAIDAVAKLATPRVERVEAQEHEAAEWEARSRMRREQAEREAAVEAAETAAAAWLAKRLEALEPVARATLYSEAEAAGHGAAAVAAAIRDGEYEEVRRYESGGRPGGPVFLARAGTSALMAGWARAA